MDKASGSDLSAGETNSVDIINSSDNKEDISEKEELAWDDKIVTAAILGVKYAEARAPVFALAGFIYSVYHTFVTSLKFSLLSIRAGLLTGFVGGFYHFTKESVGFTRGEKDIWNSVVAGSATSILLMIPRRIGGLRQFGSYAILGGLVGAGASYVGDGLYLFGQKSWLSYRIFLKRELDSFPITRRITMAPIDSSPKFPGRGLDDYFADFMGKFGVDIDTPLKRKDRRLNKLEIDDIEEYFLT